MRAECGRNDALADGVDQCFQYLGTGGRLAAKYGRLAVDEINPVHKQHVKVNIQIQGAAESPVQGCTPGLGGGAGTPGLVHEMGLDGPVDGAQEKIEAWRVDYNGFRPHQSLGYMTPMQFAAEHQEAGRFPTRGRTRFE